MKKVMTIAGLVLALTMGSTAMAHERGPQMGSHGMGHHMMQRVFAKLDLSEQQKEEVKGILHSFRHNVEGQVETRDDFQQQMKALVQAEVFDEAAVRALIESKQAQRTDAGVAMARMKSQIWRVLTPAQQEKASELMSGFRHKGRRMMRRMLGDEQG